MPILKQLVSNTSQSSKRRSRADLTAGMISAPLGDFRHTMHVGRGGDEFGDTSFLSTRSGEPPQQTEDQPPWPQQTPHPPSSKPGFLSRTFRHSKRSSSVTRVDKPESDLAPASVSPAFVKTAVSLPHLKDDEEAGQGGGSPSRVRKSLSSSPLKKLSSYEKPANGAAASKPCEQEIQDERDFGELTDLPPASLPRVGGGMKHAESIMSFHIDLGPSMLGDILSVMDNKAWDEDDLGFEEGKSSEGRGSPAPATLEQLPTKPALVSESENHTAPFSPEARLGLPRQHLDSCSMSSSGSAALEEKHLTGEFQAQGETDCAKFSFPRGEEDKDLSFMDEDDDEITV
ncbi:BORG4 protein, partial [Polyodon spathula]|nr:cdc42 effector protein 4-like [Polyodon spathula]XP_041076053.1 cdc42 effector protein 4-like [Polyodon spathula]XP_041076054.1 cdc42 effector protein 4-like [Polyodon spathula]MBN3275726.1 BORG4 protein [Polyodon spathula]